MPDQPFDFLREFIRYNKGDTPEEGNETPVNYLIMAGLVIISASVHRKIWTFQGDYIRTFCNLYAALIGPMGNKKSSALERAYDLFGSAFPDYPILASVATKEQIIKQMADPKNMVTFADPVYNSVIEVHPMAGFINELADFLNFNPVGMIDFLTNIYSGKSYRSGTILRGIETLNNPYMTFLACGVPDWIMTNMKSGLLIGGYARRIINVYDTSPPEIKPRPIMPKNAGAIWDKLRQHLLKISTIIGEYKWTPEACTWWDAWYTANRAKRFDDKLMEGYTTTKGDQLLKIAMCLGLCCENPEPLILTPDLLQKSNAILEVFEVNMPKLNAAAGRNELNIPIAKALDILNHSDEPGPGWMAEKKFLKIIGKDLTPIEITYVMNHLKAVEDIFVQDWQFSPPPGETTPIRRKMVFSREKYLEMTIKLKKPTL